MGHACSIEKSTVIKPLDINTEEQSTNKKQYRIPGRVTNYNTIKLIHTNKKLENEIMDITIKFAETQIQNINREKHYKRQVSNIKRRNARLWSSFVELKYPEFNNKTHKS